MTLLPPGVDLTQPMIRAIGLEPEAVILEYCIPSRDAFGNGVVLNHTLAIPTGDQYDEGIDDLKDAALALLNDVLEDLPTMDPIRLPNLDDEDPDDDSDDDSDDEADDADLDR